MEAAKRYTRVVTTPVCILLAALMLILGCGNDPAQQQARDYLVKGYSYFTQGQMDQAITEYTSTIEMDPKLAAAYNYHGSAYGEKVDYSKAITDFAKAKELGLK